ncbi:hypothetical protein M768_14340 [Cellulosimicrobium cellulans F16]|uniref:Uncharacterized protein n=1 Tax=Cellulosimicrobium cellulans F16 TaxID=1350482 RepID=A0A0M0F518_CELCE|nr:hypothetical protein M768_14340 [Cellulosimicrobium cellulans F16]
MGSTDPPGRVGADTGSGSPNERRVCHGSAGPAAPVGPATGTGGCGAALEGGTVAPGGGGTGPGPTGADGGTGGTLRYADGGANGFRAASGAPACSGPD